jgi:DNA-binding XRE family transcriptional regulator
VSFDKPSAPLPLAFRIARLFAEPIEAIFEPDDTSADDRRSAAGGLGSPGGR